jgi:hypothetical protein
MVSPKFSACGFDSGFMGEHAKAATFGAAAQEDSKGSEDQVFSE